MNADENLILENIIQNKNGIIISVIVNVKINLKTRNT